MDWSELPQHILHHILNFVPTKEAARTSILSKTWKSTWDSRSKVDLDLNIFEPYEENFPEFARKTLERYVEQGLGVESLKLSWTALMNNNDHQILDSMKQWIDFVFAAGNNLKRLMIISGSPYMLNLRASNTLVTLSLYDCKLENNNISENIKFPSLKNLNLRFTSLTSDIIHKIFLRGSPFLKSFYLISCDGLESLVVSGLVWITHIFVEYCQSLRRVDIQAPNLQCFSFFNRSRFLQKHDKCEINLGNCDASLKELTLGTFELPSDDKCWLQSMVSRFVSLESLHLCNLYNANKEAIKISNPSLRRLVIRNCTSFEDTTVINAPNLRSVEFLLNGYPFYSLPKSNKLSLVQFSSDLNNQPVNAIWFRKLKELFAETSHMEDTRMSIRCNKKDEFYEKLRIGWSKRPRYLPDAEPYDLKNIKIESVNLEQDIDIREDIDAALLQAYRALSFKFTRLIDLPYYNKRCSGEIAAEEHRKILEAKEHRKIFKSTIGAKRHR
ncbi:putative F-box/LRR-repeat protein At3g44090 [Morus notabilis]|uniref:putative F-box/LRR-repeat protein At3g44090 n=1 Tax=Morus notabilis TaxID=981085 RepID=UPI000CED28A6|nr:putative F-box/LRR-repeat protein At3g44090 [Morus notabilis]